MIISFQCKETEKVFYRAFSRKLPHDLQTKARQKLIMLNAATIIDDLRIPLANRLEALSGDRQGQHSIRINNQWRICFIWKEGNAHSVEIVDYH